jgi:ubiquinone/menaquinone biosynthesis C-methylase UbiE
MASWYERRILPKVIDVACGSPAWRPHRRSVVEGTSGTVLEIGFGSGHNVALYPAEVARLIAVEPAGRAIELARERIERAPFEVETIDAVGEHLPLPDASVDCAVSTFTLCTVPDVPAVLAEIRRVLRPGGTFHVLEHGLSDDERVQRAQRIIEPVQRRIAGGCHTTRHVPTMLSDAGFTWGSMRRWTDGRPKSLTALTLVVAHVAV